MLYCYSTLSTLIGSISFALSLIIIVDKFPLLLFLYRLSLRNVLNVIIEPDGSLCIDILSSHCFLLIPIPSSNSV